jgi:integrase
MSWAARIDAPDSLSQVAWVWRLLRTRNSRHTFATHLVRAGVALVTIRDLLGHRLITSTQVYLHVTADDLRAAAARHPIAKLLNTVKHLFFDGPLPFQKAHAMYGSG